MDAQPEKVLPVFQGHSKRSALQTEVELAFSGEPADRHAEKLVWKLGPLPYVSERPSPLLMLQVLPNDASGTTDPGFHLRLPHLRLCSRQPDVLRTSGQARYGIAEVAHLLLAGGSIVSPMQKHEASETPCESVEYRT